MALYNRKQFCELIGKDSSYLSSYIKRGKVIIQGNFIDDKIPENATFIESRLTLQKKNLENSSTDPVVKKKKEKPAEVFIPTIPKAEDITDEDVPDLTIEQLEKMAANKLDDEKTRLAILNAQETLAIARIKKQKMLGEIIPVDLVKNIFKQHFKDIDDAFKQGVDSISTMIVKQLNGSREDLAEIRGKMIDTINKKIEEAKYSSGKEIKNIVKDYSEFKGKVER